LSYRRSDDANFVGRIYDQLVAALGEANVFRDIDSIDAGTNFNAKIHDALARVDVVLVVIGPKWISKRLGSHSDFVRMEIRGALERGKRIVPVLIDDAPLPDVHALPSDIRPILSLNVARVRRDPDFRRDTSRLIERLGRLVHEQTSLPPPMPPHAVATPPPPARVSPRGPRSPKWPIAVAGVAAVLVALTLAGWGLSSNGDSGSGAAPTLVTTTPAPTATTVAEPTSVATSPASAAASEPPTSATTEQTATGPCKAGFVPRAAVNGDTVCATQISHQAALDDNAAAASRKLGLIDGPNGPDTCKDGYVWRNAWNGDGVCVVPATHDQAANDNAAAASRKLGLVDGQYGPDTCKDPYVWRNAWNGDVVCVAAATRDQAANDNAAATSRIQPGGPYGPDGCKTGFVWRDGRTNPVDHVCVTSDVRQQTADDNAAAAGRRLGKVYGPDGPDTCKTGFVWRDGRMSPVDHVCVTSDVRRQTADDNAAAAGRKLGKVYGPDGPDTCKEGFVWRVATPQDHVCVTAGRAAQTQDENRNKAATTLN
jgi:hypothetical protein